jgi:hypothetical protein
LQQQGKLTEEEFKEIKEAIVKLLKKMLLNKIELIFGRD